jgi:hypothetical protein
LKIDSSKAFEVYYALGEKRTLTQVSKETGQELNKLVRWRRKYQWEKQVAERDGLVYDVLKARAAGSVVRVKEEYSAIINKTVKDMISNLTEYNNKVAIVNKAAKTPKEMLPYKSLIYTAEDFERLVKLDLLLRGEATDRKEVAVGSIKEREDLIEDQIANDPEMKDLLRNLWHRNMSYAIENKKIGSLASGARARMKEEEETIDVTEESKALNEVEEEEDEE